MFTTDTVASEPVSVLPRGIWRGWTLLILALAPFAFGALALYLGQDANWDLRNYHWYNAYAFLTQRNGRDLLPSQTPWFYNPTIDLPFYLLATHASARVAGFMLGWAQGLNFVLLFMLAHVALPLIRPSHRVAVGLTLALLGMLGGGGIALLGTDFYDNVTSLGYFLSALLVLRYHDSLLTATAARAGLLALLFGVPAGLMMGLKLPSVIFAFGFCVALLSLRAPFTRRLVLAFGFGVGIVLGLAVTIGHWAYYLQTHYANPFFPYFNQLFHSPLAPLSSARDTQYVTRNLHDALLFPFLFAASPFRTGEIMFRDWAIPALYVLIPLAVVLRLAFGRKSPPVASATRYLLWAAGFSYLAWLGMFCIYRYAVPLEMLAPLLIVLAANLLPLRPGQQALLAAAILLVIAVTVQPGNWSRRAAWLDHTVEVELPPLGDMSNVMVLMAGFEPYAHLLPAFPPAATFVRIESNFASPGEAKGINDVVRDRLTAHHGLFMLLIPSWQHAIATEALHAYGLSAQWRACQTVTDRLYDNQLYDLCPVN